MRRHERWAFPVDRYVSNMQIKRWLLKAAETYIMSLEPNYLPPRCTPNSLSLKFGWTRLQHVWLWLLIPMESLLIGSRPPSQMPFVTPLSLFWNVLRYLCLINLWSLWNSVYYSRLWHKIRTTVPAWWSKLMNCLMQSSFFISSQIQVENCHQLC